MQYKLLTIRIGIGWTYYDPNFGSTDVIYGRILTQPLEVRMLCTHYEKNKLAFIRLSFLQGFMMHNLSKERGYPLHGIWWLHKIDPEETDAWMQSIELLSPYNSYTAAFLALFPIPL